ncbi:CLUMA_CG020387, isoform A [Clunio marinus]|uniref:CLUMA_CG020387, isoform A n=1 Tax=Clunio marinus TaxID=568069 RepID=A0A1J1J7G8_9DIPT|nr:CLUMA_CG020387, isoform A [Clunio marinus]
MEYSVLLLLLSVVLVQGYLSDFNQTVLSEHRNNRSFNESLVETRSKKNHNKKEFDEAFNYYYNGIPSKREPKFISFQTADNIEVELDFSIPLLSIPVRKSLDSVLGGKKTFPLANLNTGFFVFFILSLISTAIYGALTMLKKTVGGSDPSKFPWLRKFLLFIGNNGTENHLWWRILNQIDKSLHKNGIDSRSCMKRAVCWQVKESFANIYDKNAKNFDYIITDLASSTMIQQLTSSSPMNDAIVAAKRGANCETTFPKCVLNSSSSKFQKYLIEEEPEN